MVKRTMNFGFRVVCNSRGFFLKMLILTSAFLTVIIWDIPIVRQVLCFLYLTFTPGSIIVRLLGLNNLKALEKVLLSAGLSISFLMIFGLLVNELSSIVGFSKPLSEVPFMIAFSGILLLLTFLGSSRNQEPRSQILESLKSILRNPLSVLLICLPLLSVLGTIFTNAYESNSILIFMIVAIALLFMASFSRRLLPSKLYPLVILVIALSLLFHRSLASNYLQSEGSDIYLEYTVSKFTKSHARWNSVLERFPYPHVLSRYNNMLSITVLPTIFSNLMNLDDVWILKIVFPLFFAFVPLALYEFWATQLGSKIAFVSTFLFIAQQTFYTEMLALARQMVAELFFCLLLIVVMHARIKYPKKIIVFTILGTALIVSHYATSLIFIFFLLFSLVLLFTLKHWRIHFSKITLTMVLIFSLILFSWYIYTSDSATFNSILQFTDSVYNELGEWANPESRGQIVLRGLAMETSPSIWNSVSRGFAYSVQALIIVGFVGLITGRIRTRIDREYLMCTLISIALLAALILIPGLADTLNMTRFFHILLFFLAPLCALGAQFLVQLAFKQKTELAASLLLVVVMTPYFLFQTNFVYEVVGSDSWSIPLSKYRMPGLRLYGVYGYLDEQSAFGAQWLSENVETEYTTIYSDIQARGSALKYYGIPYEYQVKALSNATLVATNGTIYLNRLNVAHGKILGKYSRWNFSELYFLGTLDLAYSNGACEIYRKP